ncbi:HU family DNA-binding protein [Micromonospora sp. NBC_01699]|uniref:HU family DNA-binding protein n=1 Tax=Micromonospora sp. NBC_01699 TaxID=2975984 RepID=UPI002E31F8D6|nr:HU family DNA-binding protein [Micromonospora sp. NBC_01699]
MNKAELIEALAARLGDRKTATAALDAVLAEVQGAVAKGEKVAITGFGVFEKRVRGARTARNPRTGESVKVKKTSVPAFRPGAGFKDMVSSGKTPKNTAAAKKTTAAAKATTGTATKAAATKKATATKKAAPAKATATATKAAAKKTAPATKTAGATKAAAAKKTTAAKSTSTRATAAKKAPAKKAPAKKAAARR